MMHSLFQNDKLSTRESITILLIIVEPIKQMTTTRYDSIVNIKLSDQAFKA